MSHLATTRILFQPERPVSSAPAKPWLWPLPRLDGASPSIVASVDLARADGLVELGYADRASSSELVPVFAPTDGVVTYAAHSDGGGLLYLDHPGGWSTSYSALETVLTPSTDRCSRRRKSRVRSGDVLGYLRKSLRVGFGLSLWRDGEWIAVDPATRCGAWSVQPWFTQLPLRDRSALAL
jgi:murein DD-endopeptidase MepM/ murein hydrolase activator NlpD